MNYHIVRTNDALEKIASIYNLTINEIKNLNTHISNWKELIPGTRIKLPPIPEAINDELNDTEPFIEDYYPKIDIKKYESKDLEEKKEQEAEMISENIETENVNMNKDSVSEESINLTNNFEKIKYVNSIKLPPSYNYYYPPYDYYRYTYRSKKRKS